VLLLNFRRLPFRADGVTRHNFGLVALGRLLIDLRNQAVPLLLDRRVLIVYLASQDRDALNLRQFLLRLPMRGCQFAVAVDCGRPKVRLTPVKLL
jgi:hypothetical protein